MHPNPGYVPPPNSGYAPPPNSGQAPPPNSGYVPPPNSGYVPPPNSGYVPPPSSGIFTNPQVIAHAVPTPPPNVDPNNNYGIVGYKPTQNPFTYDQYIYRNMNFNNYKMQNYGATAEDIQTHSRFIFDKHDTNHSGSLNPHELSLAITDFVSTNMLPDLNYQDVMYLMHEFDYDKSGKINFTEFKMMLHALGGKKYSQPEIVKAKKQH